VKKLIENFKNNLYGGDQPINLAWFAAVLILLALVVAAIGVILGVAFVIMTLALLVFEKSIYASVGVVVALVVVIIRLAFSEAKS
jgi:hypothetical protein